MAVHGEEEQPFPGTALSHSFTIHKSPIIKHKSTIQKGKSVHSQTRILNRLATPPKTLHLIN